MRTCLLGSVTDSEFRAPFYAGGNTPGIFCCFEREQKANRLNPLMQRRRDLVEIEVYFCLLFSVFFVG